MDTNCNLLENMQPGESCCGFQLIKKEQVQSLGAVCYLMEHGKTKAQLLYFDRADENKTFSISFKTLPEDNTGVFHILEHSLLNGSEKFPVKEPFVSLLQNSMQTFLNAMTFPDKTVFPVSSRNEQDLFNLMTVYLDGVFCPLIYKKPEIFMQEGWHYEFGEENQMPYYNGVVYSEMKGEFADVDQLMEDETQRMLFPDTSYGFCSGGKPEHITDLTYERFLETHRRFYHPSNSRIVLDGHMDVEKFLQYIDEEYLSRYDYREPDFDFTEQAPVAGEKTIFYEAQEGEEELAHMSMAKLLCTHKDVEKLYAAKILADYLTGSNEAPLKRAFLENGLAQDMEMGVHDQVYQPSICLVAYNTQAEKFEEIRKFVPEMAKKLAEQGLDREALGASLERFAFENKEISEPYGVEIVLRVLSGWLYGDDPLTYVDNTEVFEKLRAKVDTGYFEELLLEMLGSAEDKCNLYVLPSRTKGEDDARKEAEKIEAVTREWDEETRQQALDRFRNMQQWQQSMDSEEALCSLPHLELSDVPEELKNADTKVLSVEGSDVLQIQAETNGIVYLNLYFDISDFTMEELQLVNVITACFGELGTKNYTGEKLQTKIKSVMGGLSARVEVMAKPGDLSNSRQYLLVSAAMLEENAEQAADVLKEILVNGKYEEQDKIYETILQNDYLLKQALIGNGQQFAITKALSAFSQEGAIKEWLEGERFVNWFSAFVQEYEEKAESLSGKFAALMSRAFARNRLFAGCCGKMEKKVLEELIQALPVNEMGEPAEGPKFGREESCIEIPASVGFSALGHNVYALGSQFSGSWAVLTSVMTFGYLWNMVRVQGGAYGTGMGIQRNGNLFSYSYRDPNLENTKAVYQDMAGFLEEFLMQDMPLDDIIIGTLSMVDPLLSPAGICDQECTRYLKGITGEDLAQIRREILETKTQDLKDLLGAVKTYAEEGKFCAVGSNGAEQQ